MGARPKSVGDGASRTVPQMTATTRSGRNSTSSGVDGILSSMISATLMPVNAWTYFCLASRDSMSLARHFSGSSILQGQVPVKRRDLQKLQLQSAPHRKPDQILQDQCRVLQPPRSIRPNLSILELHAASGLHARGP
jgi:hypothetical protein